MSYRAKGLILLATGLSSVSIAASSGPTADGKAVQRAIAAHDYRRASIEMNTLIEARLPPADRGGPDPLLDSLFAELISVNGSPASSITLLTRLSANPKTQERAHYQFLLATAREDAGQFTEAERAYHTVSEDKTASADDRIGAVIGYARLRMMTNPSEALAALDAARPTPGQAWEIDLQRARAEALAARNEAAQASLQRAWGEALLAGAEQAAPARIASDMLVNAG